MEIDRYNVVESISQYTVFFSFTVPARGVKKLRAVRIYDVSFR
jgi:hypothetical protein